MATTPASAPAPTGGSFAPIAKFFGDFGGLIGSIAGAASAVGIVWQTESEPLRWTVIGVAGVILLYALIAQVVHPWLTSRRQQKIIALEETEPSTPTTFRLRPYEEAEHDAFSRPDDAHERACSWLDEADAPCLYLTGFSGTGKSSLLQAWLIPELAKAKPPVTTVVVRSFADPIRQLVEALKRQGAVPVDLPEDETDPRALLERAAGALSLEPRRLLIAIDQFEECLILQDDETKARLAALLTALRDNPIKGLQLLFVLRTDYLKFDELAALGLPDPIPRENWFNLEALSHADARKILRGALPHLSRSLEDQVVAEASDVDDLPGLIRPITLNMMGLVLQSFAGAALTKTAPGRLIQDYLRRAMAKPGIEELAPKLLAEMITDKGTKRPIAEADLATAAGADPALARKTLYLLGEEGVVRELAREQKIWEISHDFVARQLGQIIPRLKPSWWRQAQRAATPVALIAWLLILAGGYPIYQIWRVNHATNTLQSAGVAVSGGKGAYRLTFDSSEDRGDRRTEPGAITGSIEHVEFLNPIQLTIANDELITTLPSLDGLTSLESLDIYGNAQLAALESLDGLASLISLTIYDNTQLAALPSLDGLASLEILDIGDGFYGGNAQLEALPSLDGLASLEILDITGNDQLAALPSLAACTKLERLWITGNGDFDPPILDDFPQLKQVALDGDGWFETGLEALKGIPATTRVGVSPAFLKKGFAERLNGMRSDAGLEEVVVVDWRRL